MLEIKVDRAAPYLRVVIGRQYQREKRVVPDGNVLHVKLKHRDEDRGKGEHRREDHHERMKRHQLQF